MGQVGPGFAGMGSFIVCFPCHTHTSLHTLNLLPAPPFVACWKSSREFNGNSSATWKRSRKLEEEEEKQPGKWEDDQCDICEQTSGTWAGSEDEDEAMRGW